MSEKYKLKYYKYKSKYAKLKMDFIKKNKIDENAISVEREFSETDTRQLKDKYTSDGIEVSYMEKNMNEYNEDDFTNQLKPNSELILKIDSIELFDKFTAHYTDIVDNTLKIDWEKVQEDFKGIYIDQNSELRNERFLKAKKNGKMYDSWFVKELDTNHVIEFDRTEMTEDDSEDPRTPLSLDSSPSEVTNEDFDEMSDSNTIEMDKVEESQSTI